MSIFSSIGRLFSKIFSFLKKLLKWLGPILIIIAIVIAVFFPYLIPVIMGWVSTAWAAITTTLGGWISAAWGSISSGASFLWTAMTEWVGEASFMDVVKMAAGAAILIDPEGAADAAGSLIESVGEATGGVIGDVADALSPFFPWLIAGAVAYLVFTSDDENETTVMVEKGGYGHGAYPSTV